MVGRKLARRYQAWHIITRCRRLKGPAYTRRKYIGGVPNNRIMQFHVGNRRAAETGEFLMELNLIADESCQIRHTALNSPCYF